MGLIKRLIGSGGATTTPNTGVPQALVDVMTTIRNYSYWILGALSLIGIFFAIWVGFNLAKAEDEGKRKEAKKQLLWTLVAVIGIVLIIAILTAITGYLQTQTGGTASLA